MWSILPTLSDIWKRNWPAPMLAAPPGTDLIFKSEFPTKNTEMNYSIDWLEMETNWSNSIGHVLSLKYISMTSHSEMKSIFAILILKVSQRNWTTNLKSYWSADSRFCKVSMSASQDVLEATNEEEEAWTRPLFQPDEKFCLKARSKADKYKYGSKIQAETRSKAHGQQGVDTWHKHKYKFKYKY